MSDDGTQDGEPVIGYKVRELLADIDRSLVDLRRDMTGKLDLLFSRLDGKADKSEVIGLATKVEAVDQRLHHVEQEQTSQLRHSQQVTDSRRWLWPVVLSIAVVAVMTAGVWLQWQASKGGH